VKEMIDAKEDVVEELFKKKNVIGVSVGIKEKGGKLTTKSAIRVHVKKKEAEAQLSKDDVIPKKVEGFETDVIHEDGEFWALGFLVDRIQEADRKGKWRPAPGGVSVGHIRITAGTIGCIVTKGDYPKILSNNHVLADSNGGHIGEPITQPGPYDFDSQCKKNYQYCKIGELEDFEPIKFTTGSKKYYNVMDAAIASPLRESVIDYSILGLPYPSGIKKPAVGMKVMKSGRTTGVTNNVITGISATVAVNYGENRLAYFNDQIMAGNMSAGGDSGSLVMSEDGYAIGLLFAGSNRTTIMNPIEPVMQRFKIQFKPVERKTHIVIFRLKKKTDGGNGNGNGGEPATYYDVIVKVLDEDTQEAIPMVTVEIVELGRKDLTNSAGQVLFDSVPAGTYTFRATKTGYEPDELPVNLEP